MRKPYYFTQKKCWYCKNDEGKAVRLDPDESEAYRIWQGMKDAGSSLSHPRVTAVRLCQAWLVEHESQMSKLRFAGTGRFLGSFVDYVGPAYAAADVTNSLVLAWVRVPRVAARDGELQTWSDAYTRDAVAALKRVFAWARDQGYLQKNQIASLKTKSPTGRKRIVTDDEHCSLVAAARAQKVNGPQFALYLIASHCGARPQQIRSVTAEHVHSSGQCWVFVEHKTAMKTGKPLAVYINPCLQTLTKILAKQHPTGPLFRQANGNPWLKDTVAMRLRRIREKLGMRDVVAYSYRHTYATDALRAGVPMATVAALLGHKDSRMVSQVYGHLDQHSEYLAEAAREAQKKRLG